MEKPGQRGQETGHAWPAVRAATWAVLLLGPLVTGCASNGSRGAASGAVNDPLLGGPSRAAAAVPTTPSSSGAVLAPPTPAGPASGSLTSNAALAGGTSRILDSSNDLRIGAAARQPSVSGMPAPSPAPTGWQGADGANTGAVLNPPVPVPGMIARSVGPVSSPGSPVTSYEQAQAQLASYGVTWQRLETWGDKGEWKFTCSVPNKQNAYISRNFEARAHDYLGAIHAVLEQMDKER